MSSYLKHVCSLSWQYFMKLCNQVEIAAVLGFAFVVSSQYFTEYKHLAL